MKANIVRVREWTKIFVSWITLLGLVSAGLWTVLEYFNRQEQRATEAVLERLQLLESGPVGQAYFNVEDAWINDAANLKEQLERIKKNTDVSSAYEIYILHFIKEREIAFDVRRTMYFFERLAACVDARICDRETAYRLLGPQALWIRNNHYPYILHLRELTQNKLYFEQLNKFARNYHKWTETQSTTRNLQDRIEN
ncbi:DUF4760 domain-containing protein [Marinobacter adhaerens]